MEIKTTKAVIPLQITDGKEHLDQIKQLMIEYTTRLDRDLSFQNIDTELKNPARKYTAPEGELLIALDDQGVALGMVAYHKHSPQRCEMKRLYVRPESRGLRLGERLIKEILKHAKAAGFSEVVLDTITPLQAAIHLYTRAGFQECEPYYHNPMDDVVYMKKKL